MNIPSKSIQIKWTELLIIAAVITAAFAVSFVAGKEAVKSCLVAITISGLAGSTALILIAYAATYRPSHLAVLALAAGIVRLLLMAAGSIIIVFFVRVSILWFVVWIGVFYLVMLVFEMRIAVQAVNRNESIGADKF